MKKRTEGVELPNEEDIGTVGGKEIYEYLVILEVDSIQG